MNPQDSHHLVGSFSLPSFSPWFPNLFLSHIHSPTFHLKTAFISFHFIMLNKTLSSLFSKAQFLRPSLAVPKSITVLGTGAGATKDHQGLSNYF